MKLLAETRSGGTSHYTVEPEAESDLGEPTEKFRTFVRDLSWEPVSTAVSLRQFQHKVERAFTGVRTRGSAAGSADADTSGGKSEDQPDAR